MPAKHQAKALAALAAQLDLELWPWQLTAARYLTATAPGDRWLYPEVAIIVARQNGKTTLLLPLIIDRLLAGQRIIHTAQNREFPREVHRRLAELIESKYAKQLAERGGIRWGAGQEEIRLRGGGHYRIVAPTTAGARGASNDLVIIDELREMVDFDFVAAAKPTIVASAKPQIVYLSNAGTSESVVLNALRKRADEDPTLAYLEWSAAPDRAPDDVEGWRESNPALGHSPGMEDNLEREYRANLLGGTMYVWENEHLCRSTAARKELLVPDDVWAAQEFGEASPSLRPYMAVKMAVDGERASAVVAWPMPDKRVALEVVADVTGSPIDVNRLRPDLAKIASARHVQVTGFDPYTDVDLIRAEFRSTQKIVGRDYAVASEGFARRAQAHQFVVHDEGGVIAADLAQTIRKSSNYGTYIAARAGDVPNTAAEAAVRAAWLASARAATGPARIG